MNTHRLLGRRLLLVQACLGLAVLTPRFAAASLSASDQAKARAILTEAQPASAPRLRALLARPDVSEQEASLLLGRALSATIFSPHSEAFFEQVLSSSSARASLTVPLVRALLDRANVLMAHPSGTEAETVDEELMRIHRFCERLVSRGKASSQGPGAVPPERLKAVAQAYHLHIEQQKALLGFRSKADGATLLLRSQVAVVLREAAEGQISREELAGWLDLGDVAKGFFLRTGVLLDDGGQSLQVRLSEVARLLESVPAGLQGLSLVLIGKVPLATFQTQLPVLAVRTTLGPVAPQRSDLWPSNVEPALPEQAHVEACYQITLRATRQAFRARPELLGWAQSAMQRANAKGDGGLLAPALRGLSLDQDRVVAQQAPEAFVAAAATMLLVDATRTTELAVLRQSTGRSEPMEQLLLALNVLATPPVGGSAPSELQLGRLRQEGLAALPVALLRTGTRLSGFVLEGHRYELEQNPDSTVRAVRRDGQEPNLSELSTLRMATSQAERWSTGSLELVRLSGQPKVGLRSEQTWVLEPSEGQNAWDAVGAAGPGQLEAQLQASMVLEGEGSAGPILRASSGRTSVQGVALMISCANRCMGKLVQVDGDSHERALGPAQVVAPSSPRQGFLIRMSIQGDKVQASVDGTMLQATLRQPLAAGQVGWVVRPGARIEIRDWLINKTQHETQP